MEQRSRMSTNVTQEVKCGSLYMVDLAGSERAAVTQVSGHRISLVTILLLYMRICRSQFHRAIVFPSNIHSLVFLILS